MNPGEYHMSVTAWIRNQNGEFLISKRLPTASHDANFWEPTGGSAIVGEDALTAVLREVKEELGLTLPLADGCLFTQYNWPHSNDSGMVHICVWLFRSDPDITDVVLQPEETCDARWATEEDIRTLIREGCFVPYTYLDELFAFCRTLP